MGELEVHLSIMSLSVSRQLPTSVIVVVGGRKILLGTLCSLFRTPMAHIRCVCRLIHIKRCFLMAEPVPVSLNGVSSGLNTIRTSTRTPCTLFPYPSSHRSCTYAYPSRSLSSHPHFKKNFSLHALCEKVAGTANVLAWHILKT